MFYFADAYVDYKWEDAICCAFGCQYILYVHHKMGFDTEHIRAVAKMRMESKRPKGRPRLRRKDTVRRDLKAWKIKEEWATDRERWKGLCKTRYPTQGDDSES